MKIRDIKDAAATLAIVAVIAAVIGLAVAFEIWQCQQRFPDAVLACVLTGK